MEVASAAVARLYENARLAAGVFFLALLGGCAALVPQTEELRQNRPAGVPDRVELAAVPFYPQKDYQCGPAALATSLASFGVKVTPDELVGQVYLPARHGSLQVEMLAAARRYGLVSYPLAPRFEDLLREVGAGTPVVVLQNYGVWPFRVWHYAVVAGYDFEKGELLLRSGEKERLTIPFAVFEYTWKDSAYWAMVTLPPDRIPATASESAYLAAIAAMERVADPHAARTAYTTFLGRWPDNLLATLGLANSHYALGELRQAEAVLRPAAVRHPESVAVLNNLAQVLSDQGRQAEALGFVKRARELDGPLAAAVAETQALIERRSGVAKPLRATTQ